MRATSIAAYHAIESNGLLNQKQWLVYRELFHHGPLSGYELDERLKTADAHKRVSELVDAKVVIDVGKKTNLATGMPNLIFDVTDHVPEVKVRRIRRVKRPTRSAIRKTTQEIRRLFAAAQMPLSPEATHVLDWLEER